MAFQHGIKGVGNGMRIAFGIGMAMVSAVNAGSLLDFSYGKLAELRGEDERALEYYEKAYTADPTALPLVRLIVEKKRAVGDRAAALEIFGKLVEARPDEPMIRIEYGDFLGHVGKGDTMAERLQEESYAKALEAIPGDLLPIERLIRTARQRGDDDRARKLLETLHTDSEDAVRYYVATTKSLYDSRDEAAAARIDARFLQAMADEPARSGIARAASDHFRQTGRLGDAIAILRDHIAARPSSLDLRIRLGILHFTAGENEEGVRVLREVLEIHPKKALAHESLAKHFRQTGQVPEARHHAAELLALRGGTPEEFLTLADELLGASEFRAARILLEKAVFRHPDHATLMMKLALATSRDPETKDGAAPLFRLAETLLANPADMDPKFLLASAKELIAQGQNKAAEERLRNAIRTFPKDAKEETATALRALAALWISENRNADAAKALISRAEALEN
jgi:Flp pilus assembly protein TadD